MMKIHKLMNKKWIFQILITTFTLTSLCACEPQLDLSFTGVQKQVTQALSSKTPSPLWERIRRNFTIKRSKTAGTSNPQVEKFVKEYRSQDKRLEQITHKARPYLFHITEEIEKRNLPGELVLLPILESNYEPKATSPVKAAGLWQFMPRTGKYYGLAQDKFYDGRRDVKASTNAALDYLEYLHAKFDDDWMLALAAYNAGEGTVSKAIKKNKAKGKPTKFWDLDLPKETKSYVPKFLALSELFSNPKKHSLTLAYIDNKPYFTQVDTGQAMDFNKAAKLADLDVKEIKVLNPGYSQQKTPEKGPKEILLPVANAEKFLHNLSKVR